MYIIIIYIEEQLFKIPSEKDKQFEEWEKERNLLDLEKKMYKEEAEKKAERVKELEKQIKTLMNENNLKDNQLEHAKTQNRSLEQNGILKMEMREQEIQKEVEQAKKERDQFKQEKEKLKKERDELKKQNDELIVAKVKMCEETAKSIDQLRDFLKDYQKALTDAGVKL